MSATWIPTPTADGSWTLVHGGLEEGCHSLAGAWQQATLRYAEGCRLGERAQAGVSPALQLLDIGTGLGLNLAAALAALDGTDVALHTLTFEVDAEVMRQGSLLYASEDLAHGPWARWHAEVRTALAQALATGARVALGRKGTLELCLGDARATLPLAPQSGFDAVFLDPFSPRRAPELWEPAFLEAIARRMAPGSWLSTYSAAFRVRQGLARAGLRVGRGGRVGNKGEGTLASPDLTPPELPPRVARRLGRSN